MDSFADNAQQQPAAREDRALNAFIANWLHQLSDRHEAEPPAKA